MMEFEEVGAGQIGNGMNLFGSNDPDILVGQCVRQLELPLSDPFKKEEFLVQSRGMATWLQLKIAEKKGIFAHGRFRFQEEIIWMILRGFFGEGPERNPYTKEAIAWKIFGILPRLIEENTSAFEPLTEYLGPIDKWDGNRVFRLCRQVATMYDSYLTYRPEFIINWNRSEFPAGRNRWQGILWCALRQGLGYETLPEKVNQLREMATPRRLDWLPERLSVFGMSTMPPIFLDVLQAYGRVRQLNIFSLQPAPVFWGDVESEKWKLRALKRAEMQAGHPVNEDSLSDRSGNPLIGSLGRTGREFFNMLIDRNANDQPLEFSEAKGTRLLHRLQRWIFDVLNEESEDKLSVTPNDESILINNCHGHMREVEVLRDYLLRRFEENSSLQPKDVLVMMPSPEEYAPYIRAVFSGMEEGMPKNFPYSIVDREPRMESHVIDFLFDLLDFFEGRATNREVLDLMDALPSRAKNGWEDSDMEVFRKWITDCHAYWGFNQEHREDCGSTSTNEHTWKHALGRMALGFCVRGENARLWEDTLPYDEIEGENNMRFAGFSRFVLSLSNFEKQSRGNQSLDFWADWLSRLTLEFFPQNDTTLLDRRKVREAIDALKAEYSPLAGEGKIPLRVIRYHLGNVLEVGSPQGRFITQGVTFSGMRPMRSVSARIICILGLNDGAFPRNNRAPSFDLSGERRMGDRSSREDDRYLFLETLWCAKEFLYLSYVGQSIRQAQEIPPSVVVNELLDGLDQIALWEDEEGREIKACDALVHRQTLHPFGEENYEGNRLPRSFSLPNLKAARALNDPDKRTPSFVSGHQKNLIQDERNELSVRDLVEFFSHPAKAFLKFSLGMKLWDEDASPPDFEPLEINSLEQYKLMSRMIHLLESGEQISSLYDLEYAEGRLPPGDLGEVWFEEAEQEVTKFFNMWADFLVPATGEPKAFEKVIEGIIFRGENPPLRNGKHLLFRCSQKISGKDRVRSWVEHVCGCANPSAKNFETVFLCSDKKYLHMKEIPHDEAVRLLTDLIKLRRTGMQSPLPFFPKSSFAYYEKISVANLSRDSTKEEIAYAQTKAMESAQKQWIGVSTPDHKIPGDGEDFSNQTCFGNTPFSDDRFSELANSFFKDFSKYTEVKTR